MTVFLEELREILVSEGILGIRDFELVVPFNSFSFWNGALGNLHIKLQLRIMDTSSDKTWLSYGWWPRTVGCAVDGLYGQGLGNYLDDVEFPEIGVDDSGFETTLNILSFIGDLGSGCFKVVLHLHERAFVGGFLYCALEATLKYYVRLKMSLATFISLFSFIFIFFRHPRGEILQFCCRRCVQLCWVFTWEFLQVTFIFVHSYIIH